MPHPPFEQVLGTIGRHRITARTADGSPVTNLLATDPLTAVVWAGDDRQILMLPDATWVDPSSGVFHLTIPSAMTADAVPGQYRVQAFCTPASDGEKRCLYDGSVRFLPTPGTGSAGPVYASYDDLLKYCPQVEPMQVATSDQSGFAEQRARARTWFDDEVVRNYHPQPGRSRRMVDLSGTGAGPYMTYADPPEGAVVPSDVGLRAILDADGLEVTDVVRECVSHKAAAIIYKSSPVGSYAADGARHDGEARMHWYRAVIEVRSDPSLAAPDLRIGRDVTFLT